MLANKTNKQRETVIDSTAFGWRSDNPAELTRQTAALAVDEFGQNMTALDYATSRQFIKRLMKQLTDSESDEGMESLASIVARMRMTANVARMRVGAILTMPVLPECT